MRKKFLHQLGEEGMIRRIAKTIVVDSSVLKGIGDDCAVLKSSGQALLFASDMLVEGVHFTKSMPAAGIGWKALAVNVSDVAAMGGVPRYAVISIGLPRRTPVSFVDQFYQGLRKCAKRFSVNLVGGDTNRSSHIVVDVAILGEVEPKNIVYRSGARAGDILFVTGRLGGSLRSGRHLRFIPRVLESRKIVAHTKPHAMMDLSDGLVVDLTRLCNASHLSAELDLQKIPRHSGCSVKQALSDGEDFELLMAVSAREADSFLKWGTKNLSCGITSIGRIIPRQKQPIRNISLKGFRHF